MKKTALLTFALACALPIAAHAADSSSMEGPLTIARQGSFFVGGRDVKSRHAVDAAGLCGATGTITVDQMYVRYQIPDAADGLPCRSDPRLLPDRQDLGDDARRPHGLGRIFRAPRLLRPTSSTRPGAAALPPSPVGDQRGARPARRRSTKLPPVFSAAGHEAAWAIFRFGAEYPQVFAACNSRSRHRTSSGSRWCPTGIIACRRRIRPCRRCPSWRSRLGRHRADQPFAVRHLSRSRPRR